MLTAQGRDLLARWIYVSVKVADDFIVPYTAERLAAAGAAPGYGAGYGPFLARFLEALRGPGWPAGSYYPGGWYRALRGREADPAAEPIAPAALGRFYLEEVTVDAEGRWWVGAKAITGRVLTHFQRHLHYDAELGRYAIRYRVERDFEARYLHHHAPPIRVRRALAADGAVTLLLNTGRREVLRPDTLRMDRAERLYCAVGEQALPAWFEEPARWELLKSADERDGDWVLSLGGQERVVPLHAPWPFADRIPD
jgi:hypothetical protein